MGSKDYKPMSADEMTISNKQLFMLAIREGMGLGHACMVSGNNPETICRYIREVESFRTECNQAVTAANLDLLKASSELMEAGKYSQAEDVRQKAERVHKLAEWKEFGSEEDLEANLLVAVTEYSNPKDVAITFGMSYRAYLTYINENPELMDAVASYKKILNGK